MADFIEFIDVHKSFGDRMILDGVSFSVAKGTTFAILGPSGIGKTVTLTHIVGLLKPDSGRIIVDGQDVTDMSERELTADSEESAARLSVRRPVRFDDRLGKCRVSPYGGRYFR